MTAGRPIDVPQDQTADEEAPRAAAPAAARPFERVRAWTLMPWVVLVYPLLALGYVAAGRLAGAGLEEDETFAFIGDYGALAGALALWVVCAAAFWGVRLRRLVGRLPQWHRWTPALGILVVALAFSAGSAILTEHLVRLVAPGHLEWLMDFKGFPDASSGADHLAAWGVAVVVVAPVVEEVVFRGMLLNRLGTRWSVGLGLVASSLIFGFVHLTFWIGPAMLGMVLGVMYLRTRTLIVPIALHAANNGIAFSSLLLPTDDASSPGGEALEYAAPAADAWVGLLIVAVTLPALIAFLRRHWPRPGEATPYERS